MPALLSGKIKHKADKDIKAGEEFEVSGKFEFDQSDFDAVVRERVDREKTKTQEQKDRADAAEKKLKEAEDAAKDDKGGKGGKADAEQTKKLAELELKLQETNTKLAEKELKGRIDDKLEVKGLKLPKAYRNQINLKNDADEDTIDEAIATAEKTYKEDLKAAGIDPEAKPKEEKKGGFGQRGNGTGAKDGSEGKKALQKLKQNRPDLANMISSKPEEKQEEAAILYDSKGQLEPKQAVRP